MSRDALIVGINNYASSSVFDSLKAPANDAEGVAQILNDYGHFDKVQRFPPTRTETIRVCDRTKITSRALKNEIANLLNPVGKQVSEKVLLYFSGHGRQDQIGKTVEGYLAASNCNPDNDTIGVSLSWLKEQLEQCQARQQVVILDCCYGGDLLNFSQLNADKDGTGRLFIAACRDTEVAYSIGKESVFTRALIKTLNPEHRKKREITDADIKSFLTEQLKGEIQIPLFHNTGTTIRLTSTSKAFSDPTDTNDAANRRFATVPLQMPPLPDHFVERPEQQNAVKAELLNGKAKEGTLVVSAIYGLGGIGKSVLASKLAHDKEIQSRFDDGILWATLGQNPDILPLLSGWIQALGDYDYKPTAIESATNHLRTLLFDKQMLLVVDDVWDPEHLGPFRVGGEGSCVMVTTREARIPEARRYDLDVMDAQQALALMTQKLSEPLSKQARERAETFAARVGYLPLALELAASQIEEGVSWQELFEDFTAEVVRLEGLDTYDAEEMPDDAKRRKYSLLACFNLSLKQLSAEQLQQFAWLGVVPEDVSLTQEMAQTLWQVTSRQAGSILRTFRAKALVLQGAKQADERASYRMHDLMHDLAQRLLVSPVEPEKAGELAGLGLSKAAAHGELLSRYREKAAGEGWHTLKDDGYIFAHLTWHMEQAGQADEIRELLCASDETGRNGWYEACDALGKPAGFVNDLGRAWQLAVDGYEEAPGETVSQLFRYALIRTSLNSLASNVTADMVGGLVKAGVWQPAQGLAYAQQAKDPWRRAACISAVVPYMPKSLLPEVTKTISQIKDAAYRSYVLSKLAERFDEVWPDVLATIRQINDRYGSHRSQTPGFSYRGLALCRIINQLPQQYLEEALEITRQIQEAADRAMSLIDLAKRTTKLWPEALNITRDITDESSRSIALSAMAQHLPELWPEALNLTRDITDEFYRSRALSAMAQHLPELWPEALNITRNIKVESDRSIALSEMAQHLPEKLWPEALNLTRNIKDKSSRSRALSAMAQHLPELWPEALDIRRNIKVEYSRFRALRAMAQHLPEKLWPEALNIIQNIKDESDRSSALRAIAQHLPELWPEALNITQNIKDESSRSSALSVMAQHLPEKLWPEALNIIQNIRDESSRSSALSAIAPHLPKALHPEAIAILWSIQDKYYSAQALQGCLPHIDTLTHTFPAWANALDILAYQNRSELIKLLPTMRPIVMRLGNSEETFSEVLQAMRDVCKQWP